MWTSSSVQVPQTLLGVSQDKRFKFYEVEAGDHIDDASLPFTSVTVLLLLSETLLLLFQQVRRKCKYIFWLATFQDCFSCISL